MKKLFITLCLGIIGFQNFAQVPDFPKQYICYKTPQNLKIDGKLDEDAWQKASWTTEFVDIEGAKQPLPLQATKAKMLWDDKYLYIAAKLDEKHLWSYQNKKDQVVFLENDFEVFIDPDGDGHDYFELEVNPINNTFDLFLPKSYRNGGDALISWDIKGMKTAVYCNGTVNNPKDEDQFWTVEIAIPFESVGMGLKVPLPKDLSLWRINFSRVEWQHEVKNGKYVRKAKADGTGVLPEYNWVWSPQDAINMHIPDRWGYLIFSDKKVSESPIQYQLPNIETAKRWVWAGYDAQQAFLGKNKTYTSDLNQLGLNWPKEYEVKIEASEHLFMILLKDLTNRKLLTLTQDGRLLVRDL